MRSLGARIWLQACRSLALVGVVLTAIVDGVVSQEMTFASDGPIDISPIDKGAEGEVTVEHLDRVMDDQLSQLGNSSNRTNAANEELIPKFMVRRHPEKGVMSVGSSFIVNSRSSGDFTESLLNKTSQSEFFLTKVCNKFDRCFQSFKGMLCGESPVAQEGIALNGWTRIQINEEGCLQSKDGDKQSCYIWDEFYVKAVENSNDVFFKWESMSNGTNRKMIIPPIKVAETGQCFNRCNILRHPTVLQLAELTSKDPWKYEPTMALIAEFARADGCPCCDFEMFLPQGQKCTNFEFDEGSKTWQLSETVEGQPWTKGPKCPEYQRKLGLDGKPLPIKSFTHWMGDNPFAQDILVDPFEHLKDLKVDESTPDIDPSSEVSRALNIGAKPSTSAPVPPPEVDQAPSARSRKTNASPTQEEEIQAQKILDFTTVGDNLPDVSSLTDDPPTRTSLKKDLAVTPPPPPPAPEPIVHEEEVTQTSRSKHKDNNNAKAGSLYTESMEVPREAASQYNDYEEEEHAMTAMKKIGSMIEGDSERHAKFKSKMAPVQAQRHRHK